MTKLSSRSQIANSDISQDLFLHVVKTGSPNTSWKGKLKQISTQTFADATARGLAVPGFIGQIGIQLDTPDSTYIANGLSAGNWAIQNISTVITANRAAGSDGAGEIIASATTFVELGYVAGVTSSIQSQLNALSSGLTWKDAVRVSVSTNVNIASPGASLDGIAMSSGDRVNLEGETSGIDNGIYIWNGAAVPMTRSSDMDSGSNAVGIVFAVEEGSFADSGRILTTNSPVIVGTDSLAFGSFGGTTYTADESTLHLSGGTFSIKSTYAGQASINTLGTITTGIWNGTAIADANLAVSYLKADGSRTLSANWTVGTNKIGINTAPISGARIAIATGGAVPYGIYVTSDDNAIHAEGSGSSGTIYGQTSTGFGLQGAATTSGYGVKGTTVTGRAIYGLASTSGIAGYFESGSGYAIIVPSAGGSVGIGTTSPSSSYKMEVSGGSLAGLLASSTGDDALVGSTSHANSRGVLGSASASGGIGVEGTSGTGSTAIGVYGVSNTGIGIFGDVNSGIAGKFSSTSGYSIIVPAGGGLVGIGTIAPTAGWQASIAGGGTLGALYLSTTSTNECLNITANVNGGVGILSTSNGNSSNVAINGRSDLGKAGFFDAQGGAATGTGIYARSGSGIAGLFESTTGIAIKVTNGTINVISGTTVSQYAKVGGVIFDHFTDAQNTTTTETDLYSDTLAANTLATNGDKICVSYTITSLGSATALTEIKLYFAGTVIYDSTALSNTVASTFNYKVEIIRVSSTVVRCTITNFSDATDPFNVAYIELTGLTLSSTNILKITGQRTGVGAATGDIVAKFGYGEWKSAA